MLVCQTETAKRIDGAVCLIILCEMYRRYRTEFKAMIEGDSMDIVAVTITSGSMMLDTETGLYYGTILANSTISGQMPL